MKEQDSESSVEHFRPVSVFEEMHKLCVLVLIIDNDDIAKYNSKHWMQFSIFSEDKRP
jgi:hypothetical protein